jgi:hypothetical protein
VRRAIRVRQIGDRAAFEHGVAVHEPSAIDGPEPRREERLVTSQTAGIAWRVGPVYKRPSQWDVNILDA